MIRWTIHAVFGENGCSIYCASKMNLAPCHQLLHGLDFPAEKKQLSTCPAKMRQMINRFVDAMKITVISHYTYTSHYLWLVISACSIHPQLIYRHSWMHCKAFMWHLSIVWCCQLTYRVSEHTYISYYITKSKKTYWNVNYPYCSRDFTAFYLVGDSYMYKNTASIFIPR